MPVEVINAGRPGPPAQAADAHGLALSSVVHDDGGHAANAGVLGQDYVEDNPGGYPGVGGVAPLLQNPVTRCCSQIMSGGDCVSGAGYQGSVRFYAYSHSTPPSINSGRPAG